MSNDSKKFTFNIYDQSNNKKTISIGLIGKEAEDLTSFLKKTQSCDKLLQESFELINQIEKTIKVLKEIKVKEKEKKAHNFNVIGLLICFSFLLKIATKSSFAQNFLFYLLMSYPFLYFMNMIVIYSGYFYLKVISFKLKKVDSQFRNTYSQLLKEKNNFEKIITKHPGLEEVPNSFLISKAVDDYFERFDKLKFKT